MDFFDWLEMAADIYLVELAEVLGTSTGTIISIMIGFLTLLFLSIIISLIPQFIRTRLPDPPTLIGWLGAIICVLGWKRNNIDNGIVELLLNISNGNVVIEDAILLAIIPSALHILWLFDVFPDTRLWRNMSYFNFGIDFILTIFGLAIGWNIGNILNFSLWKWAVMIFQTLMGCGAGEIYIVYWLKFQYKIFITTKA